MGTAGGSISQFTLATRRDFTTEDTEAFGFWLSYLPIGNRVQRGHPLSAPDPQYFDSARRAKITGQVIFAVAINSTGVVDAVRVVNPLEPGLDQNAVAAIKKWQFTPATKDGKPVPIQMEVEVGYRLY